MHFKHPLLALGLLPVLALASCGKSYAQENVAKPKALNAIQAPSAEQKALVDGKKAAEAIVATQGNDVYSPVSEAMTDFLEAGGEKSLASFKTLTEILNVSFENFSLKTLGAAAFWGQKPTEEKVNAYNESYASVFQGGRKEVDNSLSRFYGRDIQTEYPNNFLNSIEVSDRLAMPLETKKLPFAGSGSYVYDVKAGLGSYREEENYTVVSLPIAKTSLRFLLPKEGVALSTINPSAVLDELPTEGKVEATYPEFSVKGYHEKRTTLSMQYQDCSFRSNRYGIEGKAFTHHGGGAIDPSGTLNIVIDRPFYFASYYQDIPLFLGRIASL